jgi:hypothetical protein
MIATRFVHPSCVAVLEHRCDALREMFADVGNARDGKSSSVAGHS